MLRGIDLPEHSLPLIEPAVGFKFMMVTYAEFWMTIVGTLCWGVCFLWMGRISSEQTRLMDQIKEQGRRIEKLSRIEHDLIKQVHPTVGEIREGMDEMIAAVKENTSVQKADG